MSKGRTKLLEHWAERDNRYVSRRYQLSETQVDGVRTWRLDEAQAIADMELMAEALRWTPPPMVSR